MRVRAVSAAVGLTLVVTACATNEASGPATAGLTTAPTTDVAPTTAPPPSSTSPVTTSPATTTTAATSTTVATLPGPKDPTARAVAVFGGRADDISQGWVPLGGWNGTEFVGRAGNTAPDWAQGADVRVSTLGTRVIGSEIGAKATACGSLTGPEIGVPVGAARPPTSGFGAIAVGGSWPLRPRPIVTVDTNIASYVTAARQLLGNSIDRSAKAALKQIVLADFDGDDDETSIVVYESVDAPARDGSGFSIIFAVDTNSGRAREIASSTVKRPTSGGGGGSTQSTSTTTTPPPTLERFRVLDVADLNGDRIMELVIHTWTSDRTELDVYELGGATFGRVAGATCPR